MPKKKKFCDKDPDQMNLSNRAKHLESCQHCRSRSKQKSLPQKSILTFCRPENASSCSSSQNDNETTPHNDIDFSLSQVIPPSNPESTESSTSPQHNVSADDSDLSGSELYIDSQVAGPISPEFQKCQGYRFMTMHLDDMYVKFPFTLVPTSDFVFENGSIHQSKCVKEDYRLLGPAEENPRCNKVCWDLQYTNSVKNITSYMENKNLYKSTTNNQYLSHHQLELRLNDCKRKLSKQRLVILTQSKLINRLNKTLMFHERFMHFISTNRIYRLHDIVHLAVRQKRSIGYIVQRLVDAVDGLYNPHYSQDDKDLAFIILQFGGPALLEIVHRAIKLPSCSTAYKILKESRLITTGVDVDVSTLSENLKINLVDTPAYGHMLKMDEHYVDSRVRWCPSDNKVYGLCYEHCQDAHLSFDSWEAIMNLKKDIDEGIIHAPKECLVLATASNSLVPNTQPVVMWPTCSKDETTILMSVIRGLSDEFLQRFGAPLMCWSTDGDSTRRIIMDHLMSYEIKIDSLLHPIISKLRFIDRNVGREEETVDYDAKHLAKRLRNYFIGSNCQFGSTFLYRKDMQSILELTPSKTSSSIKELINPKDKQNVKLATEFLFTLKEGLKSPSLKDVNIRVAQIVEDLRYYSDIIDGVLCLYAYTQDSISDQLEKISTAAFKLLCLYRKLEGKLVPSQLYHDLQCTFENAFFCAAKFQVHHPDEPLWFMLLGTDVLERLFGNMRQKNKSGFDCLEMIYISRSMAQVTRILDNHPDWVSSGSKLMTRLCLDYSKPSNWDQSKLIMRNVDIPSLWETGRHKSEMAFLGEDKCDFFKMTNVTLLKPKGHKVGLKPLTGDINEEEVIVADEEDSGEKNDKENEEGNDDNEESDVQIEGETTTPVSSIVDYVDDPSSKKKYDQQIEIDGEYHFKASIVRQLFDQSAASNDRLKRVRALGRYQDDEEKQKMWLDNVIMIGDPLLTGDRIAVITKMMKSNKKIKTLSGNDLQEDTISLMVQQIELSVHEEMYVWTGKLNGKPYKVLGTKCNMIQPSLVMVDGSSCFAFDRSFVTDLQVKMGEQAGSNGVSRKRKTADERKVCVVCKKACLWEKMRHHVGQHILNGDVQGENVCGYCGGSCYTSLDRSNKSKGHWHYKPKSQCLYFWELTKRPGESSKTHPCTNFMEHCSLCGECVWKYNMASHYASKHEDHVDIPSLSEEEVKRVKDLKFEFFLQSTK